MHPLTDNDKKFSNVISFSLHSNRHKNCNPKIQVWGCGRRNFREQQLSKEIILLKMQGSACELQDIFWSVANTADY